MTEDRLPEPARRLWQEHGDMLLARLGELGDGPGMWQLGGGTLLSKSWRHRRSFDLDITIATLAPARQAREVMMAIANELSDRGFEIDDDPQNRLLRANAGRVDGYGNEAGIDLWIHDSGLPARAHTEQLGTRLVPRLSTAQILHGKLQRDRQGLIRDAYDIALARTKDSGALEAAVNSLDPTHQRRAEITWAARSSRMNMEPAAILGWDGKPAADQHDCGLRAAHAIHDTRWIELEIGVRDGHVYARTTNTAGEHREWLAEPGTGAPDAVTLLDHAGILLHLQHQYERPGWKLRDVLDGISDSVAAGRTQRILHSRTADARDRATPTARFTAEIPPEKPRVRGPGEPAENIVRGKELPTGGLL